LRGSPKDELEEIHKLLDQGLSSKVETRLRALIKSARSNPSLIAKARCALSRSLEMQGRYRESLEAVEIYETPESRIGLDLEAASCIRVQIGLAYNYTGDHPKAIALLNSALREANDNTSGTQIVWVYAALARVYRSLNEYTIARDHAQNALEHFRHTGDWRGLAESYFGIGLAELFEGNYEQSLDHLHQALNLIGERPAPYLQGKIYTNLAGACWFLKRPQEGVSYLEKSIGYYERTRTTLRDSGDRRLPHWHYSQKFGRRNLQISPQTMDLLMVNDWPGNVRQLTNENQRILARAEDDTLITPDDLSAELKHTAVPLAPSMSAQLSAKGTEAFAFWEDLTLPKAVDFLERLMIAEALRRHKGNVSRAARELYLTRRGLQLKLGRYRVPPSEERPAA